MHWKKMDPDPNNHSFFNSSVLRAKNVIFAIFGWYFAPWICIFFADPDPENQSLADPRLLVT